MCPRAESLLTRAKPPCNKLGLSTRWRKPSLTCAWVRKSAGPRCFATAARSLNAKVISVSFRPNPWLNGASCTPGIIRTDEVCAGRPTTTAMIPRPALLGERESSTGRTCPSGSPSRSRCGQVPLRPLLFAHTPQPPRGCWHGTGQAQGTPWQSWTSPCRLEALWAVVHLRLAMKRLHRLGACVRLRHIARYTAAASEARAYKGQPWLATNTQASVGPAQGHLKRRQAFPRLSQQPRVGANLIAGHGLLSSASRAGAWDKASSWLA